MNNLIIGILGKIHSGKSTLAKNLSERFNIPIVSFGRYLKEFCLENDLSADRASLQDLGNRRIKENPEKFLNDVLEKAAVQNNVIVIEGIRHLAVMESLKKIFKQSYFIYCDTTFEERHRRYSMTTNSKEMTKNEFSAIDNHDVEKEIELMKIDCDIIYGASGIKDVYYEVEKQIRSLSV